MWRLEVTTTATRKLDLDARLTRRASCKVAHFLAAPRSNVTARGVSLLVCDENASPDGTARDDRRVFRRSSPAHLPDEFGKLIGFLVHGRKKLEKEAKEAEGT